MLLEIKYAIFELDLHNTKHTRNPMITINRITVHLLEKEHKSTKTATIDPSLITLPINKETADLVEKLDQAYATSDIKYAVFTNEERLHGNFHSDLNNYLSEDSDTSFVDFSIGSLTRLSTTISGIYQAKGGYFVYADYENNGKRFLGVFLIRIANGKLFKKNKSKQSFDISPVEHLDLNKLSMASRVNYSKYNKKDGKYLSFIKKRLPDISDYFINWIDITDLESSREYTENLYDLLNHLPPPLDEYQQPLQIDTFRKNVHSYIKSRPGKIVNLNELSAHFYPDEEVSFVSKKASEYELIIDTEFRPHPKAFRKFTHVDVAAGGINLKFSRGEYINQTIRIVNDETLVIESKELITKLREELNDNDE